MMDIIKTLQDKYESEGYDSAKSCFEEWFCAKKDIEPKYEAAVKLFMANLCFEADKINDFHISFDFPASHSESALPELNLVDIPDSDFQMLSTPVTQKLYKAVMGNNPSGFKGDDNPVEMVDWFDAVYFCNRLSELFGYPKAYEVEKGGRIVQIDNSEGFRLPTNDEWVYAACGDDDFVYAGSDNLDEVAWCKANSENQTHPVAQKKPNSFGLYDMCGNVWEWVWDSYGDKDCCYRGGSFADESAYCALDCYSYHAPYIASKRLGFRVVRHIDID